MLDNVAGLRMRSDLVQRGLKLVGDRALDGRKPLGGFYQDWKAIVALEWGKVKATGGDFRGEHWAGMEEQRSGVPAWGGTAYKRGGGTTLGRKRPSGQRVKTTSTMNKDTGGIQGHVLANRPDVDKHRLRIGGDLPIYAERVLDEYNRNPLLFKLPDDESLFVRHGEKYLDDLAKEFNK